MPSYHIEIEIFGSSINFSFLVLRYLLQLLYAFEKYLKYQNTEYCTEILNYIYNSYKLYYHKGNNSIKKKNTN